MYINIYAYIIFMSIYTYTMYYVNEHSHIYIHIQYLYMLIYMSTYNVCWRGCNSYAMLLAQIRSNPSRS